MIPVGPSILALVTHGIYDNPMVLYREYLQNAVDALGSVRRECEESH